MSEQGNVIKEQAQKKKSFALAISLILLTLCILLVILFSAKNIAIKQDYQVATGKTIFGHFKQIDRKLDFLQGNLSLLMSKTDNWDEAATLTSSHSNFVLQELSEHIDALYGIGDSIKEQYFGSDQADQLASWQVKQEELLTKLSESSKLENEDAAKLNLLQKQIEQLQQIVDQFNFKMEGNKNAMIRLSSGFDWMEIAEELSKATIVEAGQ